MKDIEKDVKIPFIGSIDITNMCNLKCIHCFNRSNDLLRDELTDEEIINVISQISELKLFSFCFCGGEPLLRYKVLLKCVKMLKDAGTYSINMVTNGLLLTDEKAKELKRVGISSIQISLDGSCAKTHNKMRRNPLAFNGAINAMNLLEKNSIQFAVSFCPTNFNIKEFTEIANLLLNYEYISSLRAQPLMVMGRANENINPSEKQYRELVKTVNLLKIGKFKFNIEWGDPIDHLIRFNNVLSDEGLIHIQSNGSLVASPYLSITFGNLRKHSLIDYINAGLSSVWKTKIIQEYSNDVRCIQDLGKPHLGRTIFKDEFLDLDLIDNKEIFKYD